MDAASVRRLELVSLLADPRRVPLADVPTESDGTASVLCRLVLKSPADQAPVAVFNPAISSLPHRQVAVRAKHELTAGGDSNTGDRPSDDLARSRWRKAGES